MVFSAYRVSGGCDRMTKAEIIDAVYEKVGGFSKKEAAEVVEGMLKSAWTVSER